MMANTCMTVDMAIDAVAQPRPKAIWVAFGRPYIGTPDLGQRLEA